jgi:outer membrane protein assembly factor BamB
LKKLRLKFFATTFILLTLVIGCFTFLNQVNASTSTSYQDPSSCSGNWSNPEKAYDDGGSGYATSNTAGEQEKYGGYGFILPSSASIISVKVRLDTNRPTTVVRGDDIKLEVSVDGGATFLATTQTINIDNDWTTYTIDVTGWTSWTANKINDDKIWTRVTHVQVGGERDVYLDWIPIEVTYEVLTTTTASLSESTISLGASVTETASVTPIISSMQPSVTFIGSGYADTNTGMGDSNALFPPYPPRLQVDDLILLQLTIRDSVTNPPSIGNGFTLLYGADSTGTTERQWIYYKFSTGGESGGLLISLGTLSVTSMARMYAFRYVELSSSFYEGGGSGSGSGSTISAHSVTTTGANRLAVSFVFVADDNALGSFSGEGGGYDWGEVGSEYTTALGGGGAIQLQAATMGTAGTISGGSYSMGSSASWGVRSFALKPIIPTGVVTFYAKADGGSWYAFDSKTLAGGSATSKAYTPTIAGTWYFKAVYGGYRYFAGSSSGETDESLKVSSVVVQADSDWPMFHGDQSHSGYSTSTAPSTNPTLWSYDTQHAGMISSPAVVKGLVYVGSQSNDVYALDAATGTVEWTAYTIGGPKGIPRGVSSSPAVDDGVVYVGSDYVYFYAFDAMTGHQLWNYSIGSGAYKSSPVVCSGIVYIGASSGELFALNAKTGTLNWTYTTGGSVSSPAVVDGVVYVGSGGLTDYNVYAFNALTGALKWSYPTGNFVYGSPAVVDGVVYIGSIDNKVYALDAETGTLKWSYATGAPVYSCPAVVDGVVYIGSTDYKVYALNAETGTVEWIYTTGGRVESSPAVANGVVYVGSDDWSVYGIDATTGAKLWSYSTGSPIRSSPAYANGVVYVTMYDGYVFAINAGTATVKHLTINSEHGSPTSTSTGDIGMGTVVTVSVSSIVPGSDGVRYVCTGWTGTGSVPASGSSNSVIFTILEDSTVTWNWKTQYYLTVSSAYGSAGGAGWYDDGAITYATLASTAVTGVPYIFAGWGGDTSGINYVSTYFSSDAIKMDGPKTATANWVNCDPAKWIHLLTTYVSTTPVLANDIIYAGAHYFLYALDASTGTEKWYYNTGMTSSSQGGVRSTPTIIDGVLYGGSDGPSKNVYAINAVTGAEIWTYDTEGSVGYSSPAVANGFVYIGSTNCKLFALDAETGALKWTYQAGAAITCSPTVANGIVYFGSEDHKVYALNAETGALVWSYTTGHQIDFSTPAVVNGVVYIGSDDCKVYALDAATGAYKWSYTTGGFVQSSPTVVDGVVYVGSGDAYVYALDAATGVRIWSQITGYVRTTPAVADGIVYVSSINRNIYALDASTGTVIWSYATGDGLYSSPLVVDGIVYVGSGDGKLYAIKAGNWRPQLKVNSAYGSPTPTTGNICKGKVVTASVESVVSPVGGVAGVRYVCTGWTGTGSVPASGSSNSVTFTLMEDSTITWNWKTQYQVTFAVSPSGSGSTSPSGTSVWEDAGPLSISASASSGYAFSSWSSTLSISFNNANYASTTATLNGPGTITANFAVSDTTPPTGSVSINSGSSYTKSTSVTLGLSASDPDDSVAQMRFSNDGSSWSSWESYATSKPWTLATSDGAKTVYVQFKDSAGNPSVSYSDGIILDTVAPSGSITSHTDGAIENSGSFSVSGSASDVSSGVQKVEISVDSGSYSAVTSGTASWSYSASGLADGSHTFKIKVTDNAGWTYESSPISVTVGYVLTVTTNPESIDSPTGSGTCAAGTPVSISVSEYVRIGAGSRYRFNGWTSNAGGTFTDASSASTTFTMPAGAVTVTANYVTQYEVIFQYTVVGGSPPAPTVYYTKAGSSVTTTAALDTSVSDWVDAGTAVSYTNPLSPSGSDERWQTNLDISGGVSTVEGSVSASGTLNPTYYHQYSIVFGYSDYDSSTITAGAKIGSYTQFGGSNHINAGATYGSTSPTSAWVDAGTGKVSYQTFTSTGGNERWALSSSPENKDVTAAGTISESGYYHQYMINFGYSTLIDSPTTISGGVAGQAIGSYFQFGSSNSIIPSSTRGQANPASAFVDAGTSKVSYITYTTTDNTERWALSTSPHNMDIGSSGARYEMYYHQYQVTIEVSGLGADATATDTVVSLILRQFGSSTYPSFAVSDFSSAIHIFVNAHDIDTGFAFANIISSTTSGKQYAWAATTGTGSAAGETLRGGTFDLVAASTLSVTYKTQYYVTFAETGLDGTATGTVLTIDSVTKIASDLPYSDWFDSAASYEFSDPVSSSTAGKQFELYDVAGSFVPDGTVTGNYGPQWLVTFSQTGIDSDAGSNTVLTVGTTDYAYDALPSGVWLDDGTTFSWANPVTVSSTEQFVKTGQSGGSPIQAAGTYSATYQKQWDVTFSQTGIDSDAGSNTVLTVGTTDYAYDALPSGVWLDDGAIFSWHSLVSGGSGKQFVKTGQTGTTPIHAAGTYSATYSVSVLTYNGDTSGQYSDSAKVSATLTSDGKGVSGVTFTFTIDSLPSVTATTDTNGFASTTIILNHAAVVTTVTATCPGADSTNLINSEDFTINKEDATVEYTGDSGSVTTALDTVTLRLAAIVTQASDGSNGDLSLATLSFTIESVTPGGFSATVNNVPVNSAGQAAVSIEGVPVDDSYTIEVRIESSNQYWTEDSDPNTIVVLPTDAQGYVSGGGWIPSDDSVNGKINFAFIVHYDKRGTLKGSFAEVFKGIDGFNYKIKSTNWNKASLTFGTDSDGNPTATLTVNGVVQKIDRATGVVVESWGNCKITVDMTDGDFGINQNGRLDSTAITVVDNTSTVLFQWGTKPNQIGIGGGNIIVAVAGNSKKN